ncbi:MAG: ABC transporter ATP-binding protein [Tannerellaceae bacterium]|jgi:iron complex transport system ATP-binding protein|nr:ABC transporter ATP-binding protein [Tannerellaceae bacterium]
MKQPVIQTSELCIGYAGKGRKSKVVHDGLNLDLFPGELTCLLGLNGVGKSTLLRTLCGFQPPLAGYIQLQDKPLRSYSQSELSLALGIVLTEKTNVGGITVYELVALGRHPYTGFFGRLRKQDRDIIERSLQAAGIAHKAQSYVAELSDGERQKAMIAKTLAQECPIVLLDEPTAFLDVAARMETLMLLRRLAKEQHKAILLSTHDIDQAIRMGDNLWLLGKDLPVICGTPEDLILNHAFDSFFGKEGMRFDPSTGRLNPDATLAPVGVEGDPFTSHWVGNALIRNGWKPSPVSRPPYIRCIDRHQIILTLPGGTQKTVTSIRDMLAGMTENSVTDDGMVRC